jgi:SAM-dependent methyltransferase
MATTSDPTFRTYSAEEAKTYAAHRLSYSQNLYSTILNHHSSTGGQVTLLLDVGAGPGNATRNVALSFEQAIGCDPGEQMIETAKETGGKTKSGADVQYVVSPAEEISKIEGLEQRSVDLLIAAMAVSPWCVVFLKGVIDGTRLIGLICPSSGLRRRRW